MREIKFRGKIINGNKWVYGYLMNIHNENRFFIGKWKNIGGEASIRDELFISYEEVNPETTGQYTGLKDKNGKEIYEGDIVEYLSHDGVGIVKYQPPEFCAGLYSLDGYSVKIIGNIYENPELLEKKQQIINKES